MINYLSKQLLDAANSPDHDSMIDRCEQMYSSHFVGGEAPVRAGDLDYSDIRHRFTFVIEDTVTPSRYDCDLDDDEYAHYIKYHFKAKILITPDTLMVDMCNYKGECEGYAVYESVRNLPVFHSFAEFKV